MYSVLTTLRVCTLVPFIDSAMEFNVQGVIYSGVFEFTGLESWNGMVEWWNGMVEWTGIVEWKGGGCRPWTLEAAPQCFPSSCTIAVQHLIMSETGIRCWCVEIV